MILPRLLALFIIVPIVELVLLVWLGGQIGFWPTVGLIVVTAVIGAWLAKREGLATWRRFQQRVAAGQLPGRELTDAFIILGAGALLLTPGVLTDVVGLLGLMPPGRAMIRSYLARKVKSGVLTGSMHLYTFGRAKGAAPGPSEADQEAIDVEFEEFVERQSYRKF